MQKRIANNGPEIQCDHRQPWLSVVEPVSIPLLLTFTFVVGQPTATDTTTTCHWFPSTRTLPLARSFYYIISVNFNREFTHVTTSIIQCNINEISQCSTVSDLLPSTESTQLTAYFLKVQSLQHLLSNYCTSRSTRFHQIIMKATS